MNEPPTPPLTGGQEPSGLRVLVVDDEPPLVKVVSSYLEREGFQLATVGSPSGPLSTYQQTVGSISAGAIPNTPSS